MTSRKKKKKADYAYYKNVELSDSGMVSFHLILFPPPQTAISSQHPQGLGAEKGDGSLTNAQAPLTFALAFRPRGRGALGKEEYRLPCDCRRKEEILMLLKCIVLRSGVDV